MLPIEEAPVPAGNYPLSPRFGRTEVDAFSLDLNLVTVDKYRRFIDAGGYQQKSFWQAAGWTMLTEYRLVAPRFWSEPKWAAFLKPNHPVVGVSWFEADAFARWCGRRLPTEMEWEASARGPSGYPFPWGADWHPDAAAVRGQGDRITWPVGSFPKGRGHFGHFDLVGNVWQWTSTCGDTSGQMVAKGGSWASRPDQNRTDTYNAYDRGAQFSHLGFRTAWSL